jgi:hypothetical protein
MAPHRNSQFTIQCICICNAFISMSWCVEGRISDASFGGGAGLAFCPLRRLVATSGWVKPRRHGQGVGSSRVAIFQLEAAPREPFFSLRKFAGWTCGTGSHAGRVAFMDKGLLLVTDRARNAVHALSVMKGQCDHVGHVVLGLCDAKGPRGVGSSGPWVAVTFWEEETPVASHCVQVFLAVNEEAATATATATETGTEMTFTRMHVLFPHLARPQGVRISADGSTLWVANQGSKGRQSSSFQFRPHHHHHHHGRPVWTSRFKRLRHKSGLQVVACEGTNDLQPWSDACLVLENFMSIVTLVDDTSSCTCPDPGPQLLGCYSADLTRQDEVAPQSLVLDPDSGLVLVRTWCDLVVLRHTTAPLSRLRASWLAAVARYGKRNT